MKRLFLLGIAVFSFLFMISCGQNNNGRPTTPTANPGMVQPAPESTGTTTHESTTHTTTTPANNNTMDHNE